MQQQHFHDWALIKLYLYYMDLDPQVFLGYTDRRSLKKRYDLDGINPMVEMVKSYNMPKK